MLLDQSNTNGGQTASSHMSLAQTSEVCLYITANGQIYLVDMFFQVVRTSNEYHYFCRDLLFKPFLMSNLSFFRIV